MLFLRVYIFFTTQFSIFISLCNDHYIISLCVILIHPWCKLPETHVCVISHLVLSLCVPVDCCPQGASVHGILQARVLEPLAMPSSRGSSQPKGKPESLRLPALAGGFFTTEPSRKLSRGPQLLKSYCQRSTVWNATYLQSRHLPTLLRRLPSF